MTRQDGPSSLENGVSSQGIRKICCDAKKKTIGVVILLFVLVMLVVLVSIFLLPLLFSQKEHINTIINSQFVGQLMRGNGTMDAFSCSIFLIGQSYVVTADHCSKSQNNSFMTRVVLDGKNFTKLAEAIEFPENNFGYVRVLDLGMTGDIKVMDAKNLNLSKGTDNFKLPSSKAKLPKELKMQILKEITGSSSELVEITLPVIDEQTCNQIYTDLKWKLEFCNELNQTILFCAGDSYIKGGNSGAPIYAYDENGIKVLYGILSLGPINEKSTAPSVFVDIRPYVTKITDYQKSVIEASLKQRKENHDVLSHLE